MQDDVTPHHQMPARGTITLEVLAERLTNLQDGFHDHRKDFRRFLDKQEDNEKIHSEAIGRCGRWGKDIETVRNVEMPDLSKRVSNLESSDKIEASTARPASEAQQAGWGKMDWISFFSGLGALLAAIVALAHGATK